MSRVGIRDVAKQAGVSVGTVSRVINEHPSVAPKVRALVKEVIAALEYRPDAFAQSMRRKTSRLIGIVIPDLSNPFFAELVQSAERVALAHGHNVIFMSSLEEPAAEIDNILSLASRKVDGIIVAPCNGGNPIKAPRGVPLIVIDRVSDDHPGIAADHRGGSRVAVEYLIGLGHERIACIAGPENSAPARDRLAGYLDVMQETGRQAHDLIAYGGFDYDSGRAAANFLLARAWDERPTAIFASSDQQAIGCLRAAADLGIPVPTGLSIIGFDGIPISDLVNPRLTTVAQPVTKIAEAAVYALLGQQPSPEPGKPLMLACELVVRESCGKPARQGQLRASV